MILKTNLKQLSSCGAVDRDSDGDQGDQKDNTDDHVEGIILVLKFHWANHPNPFPKLDLWETKEWKSCYLHKRCTFYQR